jgi:two-component system response regulator
MRQEPSRTILLVEDDEGDHELIRRAMQDGVLRYDLQIVEDGEAALEYLQQRGLYHGRPPPDLVLLDLNIPRLDGKQVLMAMQKDRGLRRIPVVVLTTSRLDSDIRQAYELGAKSYIVKPVDIEQYSRTIRTVGDYWFGIVIPPPISN